MEERFKFRSWVEGKGMYYSDLYGIIHDSVTSDGMTFADGAMDWVWLSEKSTVMQATGLNDAHGKLIYEGDIVSYPDWKPCEIWWDNDFSAWLIGIKNSSDSFLHDIIDEENLVVIGNVFENAELLQK